MKKFIILFILITINANAQKELWGTSRQPSLAQVQGNIVKFDINGENAVTVHQFNFPIGKVPIGKLFLASNGKLYGTTPFGGIASNSPTGEDGNGVLYEYDLTFDTYRVVHFFNGNFLWQVCPTSSLIEPIPGKLYGGTLGGGFFVYDIATETVTPLTHTYSFVAMGPIYSDLIKASNGFVYAISDNSFPCVGPGANQPNLGSVIRINTTTNTADRVATFNCNGNPGEGSEGILIEALPNKIFFTSNAYRLLPPELNEGFISAVGAIVEFNTLTNTLTPKITFDATNSLGFMPKSFVLGDNGNLYGVCQLGGDTYRSPFTSGIFNKAGSVFEYNPTNNSLVKLADFMPFRNLPNNIIRLSTGEFAGNLDATGLFKFNITTNTLQFPDALTYSDFGNQASTQNLIEICRKPSYHFFDVNTFDTCAGGNFTYDIQNTNAATYQWLKDGNNVSNQTTGILNLTNLAPSDAGNYTCLMTNECGTTTTMVLHLTVNCLGTDTFADLEKSIKLYPNPTKDILNIKLPENIIITINNIKIANSLGQIIREQKTQNNPTIDVGQLQTGIYFIALTTNYGDWNGKFIKE